MTVQEMMTPCVATCSLDTPIRDVARTMADEDCTAVTVVVETGEPVGVVTDRDIAVRLVARGRNPLEATAAETMSEGAVTVWANADLDEAVLLMKRRQLCRLVVLGGSGSIVGILAQADLDRTGVETPRSRRAASVGSNGPDGVPSPYPAAAFRSAGVEGTTGIQSP